MSKIYIVKSSSGSYDDYRCWNEKAFIKQEDAKVYAKELDKKHYYKPPFITDKFIELIEECEDLVPNWESFPEYPITDANRDAYNKWIANQVDKQVKTLLELLYTRGLFITEQMYDAYQAWRSNEDEEWHNCIIEEIELL